MSPPNTACLKLTGCRCETVRQPEHPVHACSGKPRPVRLAAVQRAVIAVRQRGWFVSLATPFLLVGGARYGARSAPPVLSGPDRERDRGQARIHRGPTTGAHGDDARSGRRLATAATPRAAWKGGFDRTRTAG